MAKKSNVDLLVEKGLVTKEQLDEAKNESRKTGMLIEKVLEKLGFISENDIAQVIADSMGVPFMDLTDYLIDSEVIKLIPENVAKKYQQLKNKPQLDLSTKVKDNLDKAEVAFKEVLKLEPKNPIVNKYLKRIPRQ